MKIILTPTTGQPFTLADSPDPIPLANLRLSGSRAIQDAQFFRATNCVFYDRGNRRTEVTFDTTRLFASPVDAESFLLMHETQFPGRGLVTFIAGQKTGQTASRYLANAVVESVQSSLSGCTTRHRYRIVGGIMSASPN